MHKPSSAPYSEPGPSLAPDPPFLLEETSQPSFRELFGGFLAHSSEMDAAILSIRLGAVDLSHGEVEQARRMRVLVAEVNARTLEGEAYALLTDPGKRANLDRIVDLLRRGVLHLRSAPLGGWSPDFSLFCRDGKPQRLLLGLHWFHRPFPQRGPAWAMGFGPREASRARARFLDLWEQAHDISVPVLQLLEGVSERQERPQRGAYGSRGSPPGTR